MPVTIAKNLEITPTERREERFRKFHQLAWLISDTQGNGIEIGEKRRLLQPVPSCFTVKDLITWICNLFKFETRDEGLLLAFKMYRDGFILALFDHSLLSDSDEIFLRVQAPIYWPTVMPNPTEHEYAVYLVKCNMKRGPGSLKPHEMTAFTSLNEKLKSKWGFIVEQAVALIESENAAGRSTTQQNILDSQERFYWYMTGNKAPKEKRQEINAAVEILQEKIITECNLSENARKSVEWSKGLMNLLNCQEGRHLFSDYVKSEHSEENLEFWDACRQLKAMTGVSNEEIKRCILEIWARFLKEQAPDEINLPCSIRMKIKLSLDNEDYSVSILEEAMQSIQNLMYKDSFVRFLKSKEYLSLVLEYENYQWMIV